jgi:hypothetical protein
MRTSISTHLHDYAATLTVAAILIIVYLGQLAVAGSLHPEAAFIAVRVLPDVGYLIFNPWMHSFHQHLVGNLVMFVLLAGWTEHRVNSAYLAVAIIVTGYSTNLVPAMVGFGEFGVGASGITNALWAYFTGTQFARFSSTLNDNPPDFRAVILHLTFFGVGLVFVLQAFAEFLGYVPVTQNTATGAHLLGVCLGFGWLTLRCIY